MLEEELIDRIYEAGIIPERWPSVLDEVTSLADVRLTALVAASDLSWHSVSSTDGASLVREYIDGGWGQRTDRLERLLATRHAGFVRHVDMYSQTERERDPMYLEYAQPRGIGWGGAATIIPIPSGETLFISLEGRLGNEFLDPQVVEQLDRLRPHFARAALVSARLAFERSRAAAVALDIVGLPAAVLSHHHRIVAANSSLEALMPHVILDASQRVALGEPRADALLERALTRLARSTETDVGSVPIHATRERPPYIVHVVPVRRSANDVFSNASAILVVTPVVPAQVPTAQVLQGLFDLTPAEARVANAISQLGTIDTVADQLGVSRETIRTQLKSVLSKTGTSRQADLAALLAGAALHK